MLSIMSPETQKSITDSEMDSLVEFEGGTCQQKALALGLHILEGRYYDVRDEFHVSYLTDCIVSLRELALEHGLDLLPLLQDAIYRKALHAATHLAEAERLRAMLDANDIAITAYVEATGAVGPKTIRQRAVEFVNSRPEGTRAADLGDYLGTTSQNAGQYLFHAHKNGDIGKLAWGLFGPRGSAVADDAKPRTMANTQVADSVGEQLTLD